MSVGGGGVGGPVGRLEVEVGRVPGPGVEGVGGLVADGEGLAEDTDFGDAFPGCADAADGVPAGAGELVDTGRQGVPVAAGDDEFRLVVAGEIVIKQTLEHGVKILPVDSEQGRGDSFLRRRIL